MIDCLLAYCVVTTTSYVGRLFCFNTPEQQTEKLNSMKLSIKQSILFISIEKILLYSSNRQIKLMLKRQQVATTIWDNENEEQKKQIFSCLDSSKRTGILLDILEFCE